jgi:hypothetical protein
LTSVAETSFAIKFVGVLPEKAEADVFSIEIFDDSKVLEDYGQNFFRNS